MRTIFSVSWTALLRSNWMYLIDLVFYIGLLRCSCYTRQAVLLAKVFSQAGLIMRPTRLRMLRSRLAHSEVQ